MKFVSSQEVIEFHDRLISRDGGVAGMSEPGRADAIIHRVLNHGSLAAANRGVAEYELSE